MTYDKLTFDLLLRAKARNGYDIHISVIDLAKEYGKEPIFVRQRLVRLHKEGHLVLSAADEYNNPKIFEQWRDEETFFACPYDGNRKLIRLTDKGDEALEQISAEAEGPEPPKRSIGFHA